MNRRAGDPRPRLPPGTPAKISAGSAWRKERLHRPWRRKPSLKRPSSAAWRDGMVMGERRLCLRFGREHLARVLAGFLDRAMAHAHLISAAVFGLIQRSIGRGQDTLGRVAVRGELRDADTHRDGDRVRAEHE